MTNAARYFWLPVADGSHGYGLTRHAFPGRRADASTAAPAHCGKTFALAVPSEMDWICAPTCQECNDTLKAGHAR